MMIDPVVLITTTAVTLSSVWVYLDATKNKIGRISNVKSWLNRSAMDWAIRVLGLWPIMFLYLVKRRDLIERATENPIEATGRGGKAVALAIVG